MHPRFLLYAVGITLGVMGLPLLPPFRLGSGAPVPPEFPPFSPQQPLNSVAPSNGELPAVRESHALRPSLSAPLHAATETPAALRPALRGSCHGHARSQPMTGLGHALRLPSTTSTSPNTTAPLTTPRSFLHNRPYSYEAYGGSLPAEANDSQPYTYDIDNEVHNLRLEVHHLRQLHEQKKSDVYLVHRSGHTLLGLANVLKHNTFIFALIILVVSNLITAACMMPHGRHHDLVPQGAVISTTAFHLRGTQLKKPTGTHSKHMFVTLLNGPS